MHTATAPSEPAAPPSIEPITETIAAHLEGGVPAAVLTDLKDRAQADLDKRRGEERSLREGSIDPRLSVLDARAKRDAADDAAHEVRRIEAAIAQIEAVLPGLQAAEHQAAIRPAYEARKAEREALVQRIRKEWPTLTAKMIDLLDAIEAFRQAPGVEIPEGEDPLRVDVEAEARGCDSSFQAPPYAGASVQPVLRLRDTRIPRFQPSSAQGSKYAWPRGA